MLEKPALVFDMVLNDTIKQVSIYSDFIAERNSIQGLQLISSTLTEILIRSCVKSAWTAIETLKLPCLRRN